jgi:hypothetical protein
VPVSAFSGELKRLFVPITVRSCDAVCSATDGRAQTGTTMLETSFSASKLLGHATLTTTEIYTRGDPTEKLDAMEDRSTTSVARRVPVVRQADRAPQAPFVMVSRIGGDGHKNALKSPPTPHYRIYP